MTQHVDKFDDTKEQVETCPDADNLDMAANILAFCLRKKRSIVDFLDPSLLDLFKKEETGEPSKILRLKQLVSHPKIIDAILTYME